MTDLTIRDIPDDVHRRLSARAAENGRSPESEARMALEDRYSGSRELKGAEDWLSAIASVQYALRAANGGELPKGLVDEFLAEKREVAADELARVERHLSGSSGGR